MSTVLPNMGLTTWSANVDNFNHNQLAQNFVNIDNHDHTANKGVQIGPGGIANLSVGTPQLSDGAVTDGKVSASAPITDAKLASPNNSVYKTIFRTRGVATSANTGTSPFFVGNPLIPASVATTMPIDIFYLAIADYTVANKSPFLQVGMVIYTNNVVPGVNFTAGLNLVYPDSVHASSGSMAYSVGSQIANSTATINLPSQNAGFVQSSINFAFPADGYYTIAISMSGTPGAGSFTVINTQLRMVHI